MSNHDLGDNFSNLSDAEIQRLHEIVQLAGQKPGPAFGPGLFAAYDEVIARQGTTSAESSKYFTFICRMLWGRKQNETVQERFLSLLAEHDINAELYSEEEQETQYSHQEQDAAQNSFGDIVQRLASRERQNGVLSSADTLAGEEDPAPPPYEIDNIAKTGAQDAKSMVNGRRARRSRSEDTHMRTPGMDRGRVNGRLVSEQMAVRRPRRTGSVSSTRSLRITRSRGNAFGNGDAYSADESNSSNVTRSRRHSGNDAQPAMPVSAIHDARSFLPPELLQRSREEMQAIAEAFQETKDRASIRHLLARWNQRAIQLEANHDQLLMLAQNVDRIKLLKDSWLMWRQKLDTKRLDRAWEENESFFTAMEEMATKEREVNLKWIAFSHWRQAAKEEQQRTSVARRHILRRRYFTAWSNVTAVNDLKVRRFVLKKFFGNWLQRLQHVQAQGGQAIVVYENNLVQRIYKKWFFNFCERSAPQLHDRKLERKYLSKWRDTVRQIREREWQVEETFLRSVQTQNLVSRRAKAQELLEMNNMAEDCRRRKLLNECISTWKRQAILGPRAAQLTQRMDQKIGTKAFNIWHRRTQMFCQAALVHKQRNLRNAFTAWNDHMRSKFLQGQINIRLKAETLYKWTIAVRSTEVEREKNRRVTRHALQSWLAKAQTRHRSIEGAEQSFESSQRRRAMQTALGKLTSKWQDQRALEAQAQDFRETRLIYGALAKWRQKVADVELLHRKANAAEFYILATKTLRTWSRSTEEHRKYRKREAYGQIRRLCKMNLAKEMLRRMQIQLAHVRNMDRFSLEFQEDHVVKNTVSTFKSWKERAVTRMQQERQAEEMYNRRLLAAVVRRMVQRKDQLYALDTQAREFTGGSTAVAAMSCLRKLDRRLFQVKGQEQWALALREKLWEKHIKNMLRYWHEQAVAARRQREEPAREDEEQVVFRASTTTAPGIGDLTVFDNTAWNLEPLDLNFNTFAGTAQGDLDVTFIDNEGIITSTPLPGYLRTPSKRNTARAKARERLAANAPTTTARTIRFADQAPATAPPRQHTSSAPAVLSSPAGLSITPFEHRLREQGYTSPSRFGRRTAGPGGPSRFGASLGSSSAGGRFAVNTPARGAFTGFDDIPEVSEDRSRDF